MSLKVVRLWDGIECQWFDMTPPIPEQEAIQFWNKQTDNGTKHVNRWDHLNYYVIVPAAAVVK